MEVELAPAALEGLQLSSPEAPEAAAITSLQAKLQGNGRLMFKSGCVFEGDLAAGSMHGRGKMWFPDGLEYEGDFQDNVIQGSGVYRWPGGAVYEGQVAAGLRHGHGRMTFSDSSVVYEGDWSQGKRHGQGKITFDKDGTHWYEGMWVDDQKCGEGVMRYSNGDQYTGSWQADVKCGQGVMEWTSKKERYEGQWKHNKPHGLGRHVWFDQLVTEPSPANHALLLLFNRYEGRFVAGARNGYGVLHYATGARYEGCWSADLKQGPGVYVFENGELWQGEFHEDQPVLAEGEEFAPRSPGMCLQVDDLISEEEVAAVAARGLANILMVYNSDLRSLYDKYCKRPSLHLKAKPKPCFTMVTCQVWELLGDVRLITAATPLHRCNQLLSLARRPPSALASFRHTMQASLCDAADSEDVAWWRNLTEEHVQDGEHAPMQELLLREFCEFLVRLAAVRYQQVPGLERRLHTLINVHLLHQVSKTKASLPPPPRTPFHLEMWAGNATSVLHSADPLLRAAWSTIGSALALPEPQQESEAQGNPAADAQAPDAEPGSEPADQVTPPHADEQPAAGTLDSSITQLVEDVDVYRGVLSVRQAVQLMQQLGLIKSPALAMQAAAAMTFNYLTVNTYTYDAHRPRVETEVPPPPPDAQSLAEDAPEAGAKTAAEPSEQQQESGEAADGHAVPELGDADTREVLCWLDQPLLYADWVEGLARVAQALVPVPHADSQPIEAEDEAKAAQPAAGEGTQGHVHSLHQQLQTFLYGPKGLQESLKLALAARQQAVDE